MTLYKQLLIRLLVVFFAMAALLFSLQFHNARSFLQEQQATSVNNVVQAVGLALSPYLEDKDYVAAESLINAMFDSSIYESVNLTLLDGKKTIDREYQVDIDTAPSWFVSLVNIEPYTQQTRLSSGWMQLADFKVVSSSNLIYQQLWNATKQMLISFVIASLLFALSLVFLIQRILKPLKQIQRTAKEVSRNHFASDLDVPKTQELADVVTAFNQMSHQLKTHFDQQAEEADKLRVRAYQDPVSGLANRNYLMTQLNAWLATQNDGGIALLHIDLLDDVYEHQGYEQGDNLTRMMASHLEKISDEHYTIARLNQAEFMLVAPGITASELTQLGRSMLNMTAALQSDPLDVAPLQAAVSLVMRQPDDTISSLLSQADNTLVKARQNVNEPLAILEEVTERQASFGKQEWKTIVEEAIVNKSFSFNLQKAIDTNNQVMHKEMFASIEKDGQKYNAGQFLFALEQLGEGVQFDMHIIDTLFKHLKENTPDAPIAINITQNSVTDTGFMRWLGNKMTAYSELKSWVFFELPEICFIKNPDDTALLCNIINDHNFQFGIDNFGHNFGSIGYLNTYRPAYVKLDFAYTAQIDDQAKADVLSSITRSATNLSITTIASRVETLAQKDKLAEFNVQGFQGYVTADINTTPAEDQQA
ncbi:MAG: bifunctional diguanylate cyclase/phosphodiesterase [Vibrio sp.]